MESTNPILTRLWRGPAVEAIHRGAWVLCRSDGSVVDHVGTPEQAVFGRSATKSFQALPLLETGAADRFGLETASLATAIASHSGEQSHQEAVLETLTRIGLSADALQCGPQRPFDAGRDAKAERIINNCSGKHAGFLAVSQHFGDDPATYLDPSSQVQRLVKAAVGELCGVAETDIGEAIDGCSAPTFQLPLASLATGIARMGNPANLPPACRAAAERLTAAAAARPELVAGTRGRLCTDLLVASQGRLFAKTGAEAIYVIGVVGSDLGLAVKIDDGNQRGLELLVITLLVRLGLLNDGERKHLEQWSNPVRRNLDGLEIGLVDLAPGALG